MSGMINNYSITKLLRILEVDSLVSFSGNFGISKIWMVVRPFMLGPLLGALHLNPLGRCSLGPLLGALHLDPLG